MRSYVELFSVLQRPEPMCVVLDPALINSAVAEELSKYMMHRPLVVYASITKEAMETSVILARKTGAQFVFAGSTNERSALSRALLLAPDVEMGMGLLAAIDFRLQILPQQLREVIETTLMAGHGPATPDALARQSALPRRTLDRWLSRAGFASGRLLVASVRVIRSYPAITSSAIPFRRIAAMLGYPSQRSMDSQLRALVDCTSPQLRVAKLSRETMIERIIAKITVQKDSTTPRRGGKPQSESKFDDAANVEEETDTRSNTAHDAGTFRYQSHLPGEIRANRIS
jgi:hypothetical protein